MTDKPAHIVLVTEYFPPQRGGLAELAQLTRTILCDHGLKVSVLWVSEDAIDAANVHALTPAFHAAGPIIGRLKRAWAVWRFLRKLDRDDPIHGVEMSNWNAIGVVTARLGPWPVITRVSTSVLQAGSNEGESARSLTRQGLAAMEHSALRFSAKAVFNSTEHQAAHAALLGLSRKPLGNACVIPLASPDPGQTPEPAGRAALLFVGRATWRKGADLLDRVLARLCTLNVKFDVHLVGLDLQDLPKFCRRPEEAAVAHFHRDLDGTQLEALFQLASIVIMPSRYESFGLVTVEAMAHARPVVAFDASATREIVINNETGRLIEPFDAPAMADALKELIEDPERARKLGANARARYLAEYHPRHFSARTSKLYDDILTEQGCADRLNADH